MPKDLKAATAEALFIQSEPDLKRHTGKSQERRRECLVVVVAAADLCIASMRLELVGPPSGLMAWLMNCCAPRLAVWPNAEPGAEAFPHFLTCGRGARPSPSLHTSISTSPHSSS